MKSFFFTLMAIAVLTGCKKDADNNNSSSTPYMDVKIDDTTKAYGAPTVNKYTIGNNEVIDITGADTNGEWIMVKIQKPGGATPGIYHSPSAQVRLSSGTATYMTNSSVEVMITANDLYHIEGYFSGKAEKNNGSGSKTLSDGKFYVLF